MKNPQPTHWEGFEIHRFGHGIHCLSPSYRDRELGHSWNMTIFQEWLHKNLDHATIHMCFRFCSDMYAEQLLACFHQQSSLRTERSSSLFEKTGTYVQLQDETSNRATHLDASLSPSLELQQTATGALRGKLAYYAAVLGSGPLHQSSRQVHAVPLRSTKSHGQ